MSGTRALALAVAAVAAVLVPYAALGGGSYEPAAVGDPCQVTWAPPDGVQGLLEELALTGFSEAACELGVSREELVLALRSEDALDAFARERGVSRAEVDGAVRDGLEQAVEEAEEAGDLPGLVASLVRRAVRELPPTAILETLERLSSLLP
ncbi:MAG TPA: hypothetical protein VK896_10615 [Gaiellaceae bacterium]|nr:hypothetical protein [Gaiellaceae bacterium]